ncbi:MAG: hypothetical protein AB7V16_12235 [Vulcanibacillus sp.]
MKIKYSRTGKFEKEFKKLSKRYKTLSDDLENAKENAIELFHLKRVDNNSCFELRGYKNDKCKIYKLKKFACKSLKGEGVNSGIRIIYALCLNRSRVCFIEIYYKGARANEDEERIKRFVSECKECNEEFDSEE